MSLGNILVISIIALSFILVIVAGIITYKRVQPTLGKLQELNKTIDQKKEIYTRDVNHINGRVNELNQRVQYIQKEFNCPLEHKTKIQ